MININIPYQQIDVSQKVVKVEPVSAIQGTHHTPFQKQYNSNKPPHEDEFEEIFEEKVKVYKKKKENNKKS